MRPWLLRSVARRSRPLCGLARRERAAALPPPSPSLPSSIPLAPSRRDPSDLSPAITRALAPLNTPLVELPPSHAEELNELYEALMSPLSHRLPTQKERLRKMLRVNTSESAFFTKMPRSLESYAYLIRCLGVQGKLNLAHEVFNDLCSSGEFTPDQNAFCALIDACARSGDVTRAEAVVTRMKRAGMHLTAPVFTGLIQAHRNAGQPVDSWAGDILRRARKANVTEDSPLHTSVICAYVSEKNMEGAWEVFDAMQQMKVRADAVTYTAMMMACVYGDKLEQATKLLKQMREARVDPTLATHNAYINACAARCTSLTWLRVGDKEKKKQLERLALDVDPNTPLRMAFAQLGTLQDEGFGPDAQTYTALMRACAGAAEVERAQNLMSRMLDQDVKPHQGHFHLLLKACVRGQQFKQPSQQEAHIQVALAVPPSMLAIGLKVTPVTVDLVLETHTASLRLNRALKVLDELYAHHGHTPTRQAYDLMFKMAQRLKRPVLAREVLNAMSHQGHQPSQEQEERLAQLENPPPYSAHPKLKKVAWSRSRGHHIPRTSPVTEALWQRQRKPYVERGRPDRKPGSATLYMSEQHFKAPAQLTGLPAEDNKV